MAIAKKIVDTRRLAAQGRFGDTEIRNVRGRPSHVTALEAHYMDTAGINPSASKRTTHPGTLLDEYHGSALGGWKKSDWPAGHPAHHWGAVEKAQSFIDPILPEWLKDPGGTWDEEIGEPIYGPQREIEQQSKDIMTGGMENLQTQYGQYMGTPDDPSTPEDESTIGFIGREKDIREKGLQSTYDIAMGGYDIAGEKLDLSSKKLSESTGASYKQLRDVGNVQRSKSNLVYSGAIEGKVGEGKKAIGKQYALGIEDIALGRENIALGRTGTQSTYDIGMETSALGAEKGEADFMAGLRKQMNQMMLDYTQTTDEFYRSDILNDLNTLFDQYSENV